MWGYSFFFIFLPFSFEVIMMLHVTRSFSPLFLFLVLQTCFIMLHRTRFFSYFFVCWTSKNALLWLLLHCLVPWFNYTKSFIQASPVTIGGHQADVEIKRTTTRGQIKDSIILKSRQISTSTSWSRVWNPENSRIYRFLSVSTCGHHIRSVCWTYGRILVECQLSSLWWCICG